jgi:hypothetical protein
VAGLYDRVEGASAGPSLAAAPDWLRLLVSANGEELGLDERVSLSRTLDLESGAVSAGWDWTLPSGEKLRLRALRYASLADRSLAVQVVQLTVDSQSELALEALVVPTGMTLILERTEGPVSLWRTAGSGFGLTIGWRAQLSTGGLPHAQEAGPLSQRWTWDASPGEAATCIRTITFTRHSDRVITELSKRTNPCRTMPLRTCWRRIETGGQNAGRRMMCGSKGTMMRNQLCALPLTRVDWSILFELKRKWQVSLAALLMRAKTLGRMSEGAYLTAVKAASARGWRRVEPVPLGDPESAGVFARLLRGPSGQDLRRSLPGDVLDSIAVAI